MTTAGSALLARTLTYGITGTTWRSPDSPLDPTRWSALFSEIRRLRASGPLTAAVIDDAWPVTDTQRLELSAEHRASMALAVHLEQHLLTLHREFTDADIELRILKGPAIAHLDEADPSRRAYGDLDLLIRGDDFDRAATLLERRGGRRRFAEPTPGFDRRFTKGASFSFDQNLEVDLHRTFCPGPFGLVVDLDRIWIRTEACEIADRKLHALDRPGRFLHACIHAVLGQAEPRPPALRDLALTAPADEDELACALRNGHDDLHVVVRDAVTIAAARLGWSPPAHLADWCRSTAGSPRAQRWLRGYRDEYRSSARLALTGIAAVSGVSNKIAYAEAVAFPRHHRLDTVRRWRSGLSGLRHPSTS